MNQAANCSHKTDFTLQPTRPDNYIVHADHSSVSGQMTEREWQGRHTPCAPDPQCSRTIFGQTDVAQKQSMLQRIHHTDVSCDKHAEKACL